MKAAVVTLVIMFIAAMADAQWVKQAINTKASFRGLSVVNEKVIWASGTGGTVIRTVDGGESWKISTVPGAEKLDLRDIEAFDAKTAYALSIGNGGDSRIYKTVDGAATWKLQFTNADQKAFFDAIACWDRNNCIAMSDPVANKFVLISTNNGGTTWRSVDTSKMPPARDGEAAFAASGSCLVTRGRSTVFLVTGGTDARVFKSVDRGRTWDVYSTAMVKGTAGSGIFSIAMWNDRSGVIVGGNYEKPGQTEGTLAFTSDGGKTWRTAEGLSGYRSSVAYAGDDVIYAVGSSGSDVSRDGGKSWTNIDHLSYNAVASKGIDVVWAVGEKGTVANIPFLTKLLTIAPDKK